jgi:hypothetical protein
MRLEGLMSPVLHDAMSKLLLWTLRTLYQIKIKIAAITFFSSFSLELVNIAICASNFQKLFIN